MQELKKNKESLIIGIPSKGRPKDHTLNFLKSKGFSLPTSSDRSLQTHFLNMEEHRVAFFHAKDIPKLVAQNVVDIGFTGLDLLHETEAKVRPVIKLNLGLVKMAIAVREDSTINHPFHLMHKVIATSYPRISGEYFQKLNIPVTIQAISGASEGMPYLPTVDAIVDVVETGASLRANKLQIIADDVFVSEMVCVVNRPEFSVNYQMIHQLLRRLY